MACFLFLLIGALHHPIHTIPPDYRHAVAGRGWRLVKDGFYFENCRSTRAIAQTLYKQTLCLCSLLISLHITCYFVVENTLNSSLFELTKMPHPFFIFRACISFTL